MANQIQKCECCGRPFPKAKAAPVVDPAQLSTEALFAYYKRIAPVEDVKFQLRLSSLSPEIRDGYTRLLAQLEAQGGKATPATKREYLRLQQAWRESKRPQLVTARTRSGWITHKRLAA